MGEACLRSGVWGSVPQTLPEGERLGLLVDDYKAYSSSTPGQKAEAHHLESMPEPNPNKEP